MMKRFVLALSLCLAPFSFAHNNLFLPGDAYFSTAWKVGEKKFEGKDVSLKYSRLSNNSMDCGYAGSRTLNVKNLPESYQKNLSKVRQWIEGKYKNLGVQSTEYVPKKGTTSNSNEDPFSDGVQYEEKPNTFFRVLVYNKEYDFKKYDIAYKFNENWAKLQKEEAGKSHAIYDGFLSVSFDWEHAADVAGLKLTKKAKLSKGLNAQDPVEGDAKDYCFVIVLGRYIDMHMEAHGDDKKLTEKQKSEHPLQFLVVDDKIRLFKANDKGKLEEQTLDQ